MVLKKYNPFKSNKTKKMYEEIQLVEGNFNPAEAADVLLSLINYKIKFHSIQILNLQGTKSEVIPKSEKRIHELKEAKTRITNLIVNARKKSENLKINSVISISSDKI
jgi:hypothetical protein